MEMKLSILTWKLSWRFLERLRKVVVSIDLPVPMPRSNTAYGYLFSLSGNVTMMTSKLRFQMYLCHWSRKVVVILDIGASGPMCFACTTSRWRMISVYFQRSFESLLSKIVRGAFEVNNPHF